MKNRGKYLLSLFFYKKNIKNMSNDKAFMKVGKNILICDRIFRREKGNEKFPPSKSIVHQVVGELSNG